MQKMVNGELVDLTEEEITQYEADIAAATVSQAVARLPAYRFEREVSGVSYLGKLIQTDRETRANWLAILLSAQMDPNYTVTWKTNDGSFAVYNAAQAVAAALTVSAFVQKCFVAEAAVTASLSNYTTVEEVEAAFDTEFSNL